MTKKVSDKSNRNQEDDFSFVGSIKAARGLKGELLVNLFTAHPAHLAGLESLYLRFDGLPKILYTVQRTKWDGSKFILKLHNVDDRNKAESLKGAKIFIPEGAAYKTEEDEYFIDDLIGMNVVDTAGTKLGTIRDVLNYPAHDVYVISNDTKEILVPAVQEYVREVNLNTGTVMISIIDGLSD